MIVAIAEESRGGEHARQWIEQAGAQYWCLIDTEHRVADLYGMVNVPQAVWIDEAGRIVRPPENAGSTDHFRLMDRTTRTLAPEHQAARLAARSAYLDAVRDWVLTGKQRSTPTTRGGICRGSRRRSRSRRRISDWACGCAGTAMPRKAMRIWRRPAGCILSRGTSGARRPISTRSARRAARLSGSVCRHSAIGRTIRLRDCETASNEEGAMTTNDATFAGSIPALYDRHLGPVLFEPYAADKVRRFAHLSEGAILETASGTGIVTQQLASALPAAVRIVATDLNQPMLDHAASKPGMARVEFRQADALKLPSPDGQFDAIVCQFGVMFFPDRVAAYREARRVLKPNGQLVFSVWDSLMRNPVVSDRHRRHGDPLSARPAAIPRACATWLSRCRRDTRGACCRRLHHSRNRDGRADSSCGVASRSGHRLLPRIADAR